MPDDKNNCIHFMGYGVIFGSQYSLSGFKQQTLIIHIIHALFFMFFVNQKFQIEFTNSLTGPISFQSGKRDTFVLEVIETLNPLSPIGIWRSENPDKVILTRNATQREEETMRRLRAHNFIVTSK